MRRKNNLSPLAFYTSLDHQNQNVWYSFNHMYTCNYLVGFVPPFQFIIPDTTETTGVLPSSFFDLVAIQPINYPIAFDIKTTMIAQQGLTAEKFDDGYIIVKNPSTAAIVVSDWNPQNIPGVSSSAPLGPLYLHLNMNSTNYYSEYFNWTDTLDKQSVQLQWSHSEDLKVTDGTLPAHLDYTSYVHKINFPTTIGKPTYEFEEEIKPREGYKFPVHQISYKKYKFEFLAPEYVCDALRLVRLHDTVTLIEEGDTYNADEILFTVNWQDQGNLAQVVCEFTTDTVVAVSGRATQP